ncbi:hypothetical protein Tco_0534529 [Tanacetum coccineum]
MLEVVTALAAEEAHSEGTHSQAASSPRDAQGTPSQSAAHDSSLQGTAASQGTASLQGTAASQGTASPQGTAAIPKSPNDYTPTDASQTSGGDEGLLDLYALTREVKRLKRQTLSQAKQIIKLKTKLKKLSKMVQPVVQHHTLWVETDPFFEDVVDKDAAVTPDLERKSDETEEINVEEKEASNVKSGDTEELDLETFQSTARQSTVTPRTLNFDDEAGGKTTNDEEVARKIQAEWDAEEERKRLEELKKAKAKDFLSCSKKESR